LWVKRKKKMNNGRGPWKKQIGKMKRKPSVGEFGKQGIYGLDMKNTGQKGKMANS